MSVSKIKGRTKKTKQKTWEIRKDMWDEMEIYWLRSYCEWKRIPYVLEYQIFSFQYFFSLKFWAAIRIHPRLYIFDKQFFLLWFWRVLMAFIFFCLSAAIASLKIFWHVCHLSQWSSKTAMSSICILFLFLTRSAYYCYQQFLIPEHAHRQ